MKTQSVLTFLLLSLTLNGCWGWYDCSDSYYRRDRCYDHDYDYDYDSDDDSDYTPPAYDYDPAVSLPSTHWFLSVNDGTKGQANNGLLIKGVSGEFVRNKEGAGGKLLIDIDASNASLSCGVKLELMTDGKVSSSADVVPVAHNELFTPESLNTGCLGAGLGAKQGLAVFELEAEPSFVTLNRFSFGGASVNPSEALSVRGSTVDIHLDALGHSIEVTIRAAAGDTQALKPLLFEATLTGLPILGEQAFVYDEVKFSDTIEKLVTSTVVNKIQYRIAIKNPEIFHYMNLNTLNILSAHEAAIVP